VPRGLKVYRTAIGFHDAYVAAPSQKAALAAWGTDKNLFARGAAEVVSEPALTKAPLAQPGEVIRVPRGSAAEHVKALGALPKRARRKAEPEPRPASPAPAKKGKPQPPPKPPRPSRDEVRFAEAALSAATKRRNERLSELAEREKALAAERKRIEREQAAEIARFEKRLRAAQASHAKALARWEKG
jgi:hypothetical protein